MKGYLKCDEPICDHKEWVEGFTRDLVNKPCPKCGANLMTEGDYKAARRIGWVIWAFKKLGLAKDAAPDGSVPAGYSNLDMHVHDGKVTIKETNQE